MPPKLPLRPLLRSRVLLFLPVLFTIPALIALFEKDLVIFPGLPGDRFVPYSDSMATAHSEGSSYVKELSVDSAAIRFSFRLVKDYYYPYAGFALRCAEGDRFVDLTGYDYLALSLDPCNSRTLRLQLQTFAAGLTVLDSESTYRPSIKEIDLSPGKRDYAIDLDEFITEMWWFRDLSVTESKLGKADFSKLIDINIESGELTPRDTDQEVVIHAIRFRKDARPLYLGTLIAIVLYYTGYGLFGFALKKLRVPSAVPYEKLSLINYNDEYLDKIVGAISKDYNDRSLTITKIGDKIGVTPAKIAQVIHLSFNLSFKQYLNTIRLAEAKRLFRETDRQISEIVYSVGYQSLAHFYRVFKQVYGITPNEYRKKYQ